MIQRIGRAERLVGVGFILVAVGIGLITFAVQADHPRKRMSALELNVDLRGGTNYTHFEAPNPEVCADACLSDSRCMAFSYSVEAQECWLKRDVPAKVEEEGFVSAVKLLK